MANWASFFLSGKMIICCAARSPAATFMSGISAQALGLGFFMPHGECLLWNPYLLWLDAISDSTIALAYYSIPFLLLYFLIKRRDMPFRPIFWMFGFFILSCGTTHLMDVVNMWWPAYWAAGAIKAVTALASMATVV